MDEVVGHGGDEAGVLLKGAPGPWGEAVIGESMGESEVRPGVKKAANAGTILFKLTSIKKTNKEGGVGEYPGRSSGRASGTREGEEVAPGDTNGG